MQFVKEASIQNEVFVETSNTTIDIVDGPKGSSMSNFNTNVIHDMHILGLLSGDIKETTPIAKSVDAKSDFFVFYSDFMSVIHSISSYYDILFKACHVSIF